MPLPSDAQELVRGLRRRDPELLDRLIEQYHYRLFRYLFYLTGQRDTAEDLFQETWIRVLERGHQYDGNRKFEAWLFAIARHLTIDFQRRRKPEYVESLAAAERGETAIESLASADPLPLEVLAAREESQRIGPALARLPALYREALLLRFQEDMSLEEIAAVTAAPLSTVKSRLYRGLESLRRILEGGKQ